MHTIAISETARERVRARVLSALYGQFADVQTVDEVLQSLDRGEKARAA